MIIDVGFLSSVASQPCRSVVTPLPAPNKWNLKSLFRFNFTGHHQYFIRAEILFWHLGWRFLVYLTPERAVKPTAKQNSWMYWFTLFHRSDMAVGRFVWKQERGTDGEVSLFSQSCCTRFTFLWSCIVTLVIQTATGGPLTVQTETVSWGIHSSKITSNVFFSSSSTFAWPFFHLTRNRNSLFLMRRNESEKREFGD